MDRLIDSIEKTLRSSDMPGLVRFIDLSIDAAQRDEYLTAIDRILASGQFLNSPEGAAFEKDMAAFCGVPYVVGVGSGTAALFLALKALRIGSGDEVILPALSFVGTANAVAAVGATPIFVDVRTDLLMDPDGIEAAITSKTKAIMPVHFTGNVCDMDSVLSIAKRHALPVVEDAAPAFGATFRGKKAGTFGILGCFSMNPMKVLGGIGEAGAVLASSAELFGKLQELRYHGIRNKDICVEVSLNERLDAVQAAVLAIRLRHHDRRLAKRRRIAERYGARLGNVVTIPEVSAFVESAWYHYTILCDRRDDLMRALEVERIESRVYHARLMPAHPVFAVDPARFAVGSRIVDRILCLPMHEKLRDDEVDRVIEAVSKFYGRPS
jgi:dTDP-4-amino-4,6-dideoxygalactose transaminase